MARRVQDTASTIQFGISLLIRASILAAILTAVWNRQYFVFFISTLALLLTFLPAVIQRHYRVHLTIELELVALIFIYASLFLGEVHKYYTRFWWWDVFLHGMASLTLGIVGFLIIYVLYRERRIAASAFLIAVFSFSFAMAAGAVWEIIEFSIDSTLLTNMQKSGLVDTMTDLIVDAAGALAASIAGFFYVKYGHTPLFEHLVTRFVRKNPRFFRRLHRRTQKL